MPFSNDFYRWNTLEKVGESIFKKTLSTFAINICCILDVYATGRMQFFVDIHITSTHIYVSD